MPHLRIKLLSTLFFIAVSLHIDAQVAVNGTVTDSSGKPLSSVSITIKKRNGIVLSFAITNAAGTYKMQNPNASVKDTLVVEANSMGYVKQKLPVTSATQVANFTMQSTIVKLPNVTVKANPLKKEGDTLNYDVATFSNKQDRTIGDVIKKLPGVEVADNGQISVGGKAINRFYIDGDNLLDGKYNIATKGIPNDMVSKIQVLENHQPVKALRDIEKSESAAMNIVLKDKARIKIIGTGDAAIGTPSVYNAYVNAMLFQKKVKFINFIKMNNIGVDNSEEIFNHFLGDNVQPVGLLSAGGAGNPALLKKRYLFNNVGLVTVNDLVNLKSEYQLRINAFYLWDRQFQKSQYSSANFLPNDTIRYTETQDARIVSNTFNTQFTLTANKKDYFLNNVTVIENTPSQVLAGLQATSNNNIIQNLNGTVTSISNRFNIIKKFTNGKVLEGFSSIGHINNPATLLVEPGLYAAQFNNNLDYAGLIQHASVPTVYSDNYISFGRAADRFQQKYKIGVNYQNQHLNSLLELQQLNGNKAAVADSFINRMRWERLRVYVQADFTYTSGSVMLRLTLPVTYQDTKYTGRQVENHATDPLIMPRLSFRYLTGKEDFISLGYNYGNSFGGINQVYDSYVMTGYRNFFMNGNLLNQSRSHSFNGSYVFKNTMKIFFFSAGGSYLKYNSNTINDTRLSSVLQQSRLIPFDNVTKSMQLFTTVSKYIFPIMTTLSGKVSWQQSIVNQLQNGNLVETLSDSYSYNASINSKFASWFNMSYAGTYTTFGSKPIGNTHTSRLASPKVQRWQHEVVANFVVSSNFYFRVMGDNYQYHLPGSPGMNYTFADAAFTYKLNQYKTDIELSLTNLANVDTYGSATLSANSIVESSYRIRPRMAMVKFYFRF